MYIIGRPREILRRLFVNEKKDTYNALSLGRVNCFYNTICCLAAITLMWLMRVRRLILVCFLTLTRYVRDWNWE